MFLRGSTVCHAHISSWKIGNTRRETAESNEVSASTRRLGKVLYKGFTKKRYDNGTQVFHVIIVIGKKSKYIHPYTK